MVRARADMTLGAGRASLGTQSVRTFNAALVRPHAGDALDLALEIPTDATPEELNISIFALMQGVLWMMDDAGVLLMDRAFRYLKSYWDEGAEYGGLTASRDEPGFRRPPPQQTRDFGHHAGGGISHCLSMD